MIYKILIFLVFIAEVILCVNIICWLLCADKFIQNVSNAVVKIKPDIKEVCELSKVISWQMKELTIDFVDKVENKKEAVLSKYISKLLLGVLLWKLNIKVVKKLKKYKILKIAYKGLTALANVV